MKKIFKNLFVTFLATSFLFYPIKAIAETILNKKYEIIIHKIATNVRLPEEQRKRKTFLDVKAEMNKVDEDTYNIDLSFLTNGYDSEKQWFEYDLLDLASSSIFLAHKKSAKIENVSQDAYLLFPNKEKKGRLRGRWIKLLSLEKRPWLKYELEYTRMALEKVIGKGNLEKLLDFVVNVDNVSINEALTELKKEYEITQIPFHASGGLTSAIFEGKPLVPQEAAIKISVKISNPKNEKAYILAKIALKQEKQGMKEIGALENLLIELPFQKSEEKIEEAKVDKTEEKYGKEVIYEGKQKVKMKTENKFSTFPEAILDMKVNYRRVSEKEQEIEISFMPEASFLGTSGVTEIKEGSISLIHPKSVRIGKPKQDMYQLFYNKESNYFYGKWKEGSISLDALILEQKKMLQIIEQIWRNEIMPAIGGKGYEVIEKIHELYERIENKEKMLKEFSKNYEITEIPFCNLNNTPGRKCIIPVENPYEEEIGILLNLDVERNFFSKNEVGSIDNLFISIPKSNKRFINSKQNKLK